MQPFPTTHSTPPTDPVEWAAPALMDGAPPERQSRPGRSAGDAVTCTGEYKVCAARIEPVADSPGASVFPETLYRLRWPLASSFPSFVLGFGVWFGGLPRLAESLLQGLDSLGS
jgi:hypothetical protein